MSRQRTGGPLSPTDRLTMRVEMVEDSSRELRRRMNEMETAWGEFAPAVAEHISSKVIIPALVQGLMKAIQLPVRLDIKSRPDELSLVDYEITKQRGKGKDG